MLAGKTHSSYLRLHDPVQKTLTDLGSSLQGQSINETAYCDRMIHFWREVSLADLPRSGRNLDECYALLFESAFDLAEAEPEWALEWLAEAHAPEKMINVAIGLARHVKRYEFSHTDLIDCFTVLYAPQRECDQKWNDAVIVALGGNIWFEAAILCAVGIDENHSHWRFRCELSNSSANGWRDNGRLNHRLIREAPRRAQITSRAELMAHPLLRLAQLKYPEDSVEQQLVLRFLNARCIVQGFESEEDYFSSDLTLAQWVRDARSWAGQLLQTEPHVCAAMFECCGKEALERTRAFFRSELGDRPERVDALEATATLVRWGKRRRGYELSRYRAELWEFIVEMVDAALWLGWLFPATQRKSRRRSARLSISK